MRPIRIETTVTNTAQVRGLGGSIREFSVGEPPNLEPGSYTFAIFRDGHIAAAKVENSWEVGAKHLQIVKDPKTLVPREAVAAGELRIHADGSYDWNDASGSVTRPLSFTAKPEDIRTRTDNALELLLRQRGQYAGVDSKLLPSRQP